MFQLESIYLDDILIEITNPKPLMPGGNKKVTPLQLQDFLNIFDIFVTTSHYRGLIVQKWRYFSKYSNLLSEGDCGYLQPYFDSNLE